MSGQQEPQGLDIAGRWQDRILQERHRGEVEESYYVIMT